MLRMKDYYKNHSYDELIVARERVIERIRRYECRDTLDGVFVFSHPSPEDSYRWDLTDLAEISKLIIERHKEEEPWKRPLKVGVFAKRDKFSLINTYYAYLDVPGRLADVIFNNRKLKVYYEYDYEHPGGNYNTVVCHVRKKDAKKFEKAMKELDKAICNYRRDNYNGKETEDI